MNLLPIRFAVYGRRFLFAVSYVAFLFAVLGAVYLILHEDNPIRAEIVISGTPTIPSGSPGNWSDDPIILSVANTSLFDWEEVRLVINDRFIATPGNLEAGETKLIKLSDLTDFDYIPPVALPPDRRSEARSQIDVQSPLLTHNSFNSLTSLHDVMLRTKTGRVRYDLETQSMHRISPNGNITTLMQDVQSYLALRF